MLNTTNYASKHDFGQNQLSELSRATAMDFRGIQVSLREGWIIVEAVDLLAHGTNDEGRGYLLTLMQPHKLLTQKVSIRKSSEVDMLLEHETVPMARSLRGKAQ